MITPTRYRKCSPEEKERLRREAVRAVRGGRSGNSVAKDLGVSREAVRQWCERATEDPKNGLKATPRGPRCWLSDSQLGRLREILLKGADSQGFPDPLWTVERVRLVVHRVFGIRYAHESLRHVLINHLNFSCQKPEKRAKERDEKAIEHWKRKTFRAAKKKGRPARTNHDLRG